MMKCWEAVPDIRPTFKELHVNTSKCTETIAGYLEITFNPFAVVPGGTKENSPKDECPVSIQVIPPSLDSSETHSALINSTD